MQEKQLILIVYYGRSGSAFIHSLLDGHPDLISMPPVFLALYGKLCDEKVDVSNSALALQFFLRHYGCVVNSATDDSNQDYVRLKYKEFNVANHEKTDESKFKTLFIKFYEQLEQTICNDYQKFFLSMHYAYDAMVNNYTDIETAQNKKIVFQLHNPIYEQIQWFSNLTSGAYLLQMVRSPLVTFRSIIQHIREHKDVRLTPYMMQKYFKQIMFGATQYLYKGVEHFAVKLEDLHCEPVFTLKKLADKLHIQWNESMLHSSFCGHSWGNVLDRGHISGFSPETVEKDISDIFPDKDIRLLYPLFERCYQSWGYQAPKILDATLPAINSHFFMIEYMSFQSDFEKAKTSYEKQVPIIRSSEMSFILQYASHFSEPIVEVL